MFGTEHSINKSIEKDHRIPNKWTEWKIFELKYGNTKLLGNAKYNQVKLEPEFLLVLICIKLALNYVK